MTNSKRQLTSFAIIVLLTLLSWLTLLPGYPQIYGPLNAMVIFPAFIMAEFVQSEDLALLLALGFVPLLFCLWCWPLLRGQTELPIRSSWLLGATLMASAAWIAFGYDYGVQYQGLRYVVGVTVVNVVCWIALVGQAIKAVRRPSEEHNFVFHGSLFAWLAWYAFPYLGELP